MSWTYNPFTGEMDYYQDVTSTGDLRYLKLDCTNDPLTGNLDAGTNSISADTLYATGTGNSIFNETIESPNLLFQDDRGTDCNLAQMATTLQEMKTDTLLDRSSSALSCTGGVLTYTLTAVDGYGRWNFGGIDYPTAVGSASCVLTAGTDAAPQVNYVHFKLVAGVPTFVSTLTYPTYDHIDVATWLVGAVSGSTYTIYSYDRNRYEVESFIKRVIERFEKTGTLYESGFIPTITATTLSIAASSGTQGKFFNGIFEMFAENTTTQASFYTIKNGVFTAGTSLANVLFYSNGDAMSAGKFANVVWGIVPTSTTTGGTTATTVKLVAVLQTKPTTGYSLAEAKSDPYDLTNYYPPNDAVKNVFVPIARTILSKNSGEFQTFDSGLYYKDLRGKITSGGGAATPVDLSGLVPYTGATTNVELGVRTLGAGVTTLSGNNANATFTLLNLNNSATPVSGNTGQTSDLIFNLTQSINSVVSLHEAARISAYKVSDWFHASTEADTDSGLKFYTTKDGSSTLHMTIDEQGITTISGKVNINDQIGGGSVGAFTATVNKSTGPAFTVNNEDANGTTAVDFQSNYGLVANFAYIGNTESGGNPYFWVNGNPGNITTVIGGLSGNKTLTGVDGQGYNIPHSMNASMQVGNILNDAFYLAYQPYGDNGWTGYAIIPYDSVATAWGPSIDAMQWSFVRPIAENNCQIGSWDGTSIGNVYIKFYAGTMANSYADVWTDLPVAPRLPDITVVTWPLQGMIGYDYVNDKLAYYTVGGWVNVT